MNSRRDYATVTLAYWAFTLSDGALRMLVLLHLHELGRGALEIASLFLLYEFFGVVTNLLGGWLGARFGLKATLFAGLGLQIAACSMLLVDPTRLGIPWLMTSQAFCGIAKDLTKMSAKSYIKLVVPAGDETGLMRWVAILTGSKNALKGAGFFLGGLLLSLVGFGNAAAFLIVLLAAALLLAVALLPRAAGRSGGKVPISGLFSRDARLNWLAAARLFLFASRDAWFVLALPLFLGSALRWDFWQVGGFLALWIVGYGFVQAAAPGFVAGRSGAAPGAGRLGLWTLLLVLPLSGVIALVGGTNVSAGGLIVGLGLFGVVFAATSAIHSYLVVSYAEADRVALRVGFYYAANALGRLLGTLLSGSLYLAADPGRGLRRALGAAVVLVLASALATWRLRLAERRHGPPLA
ncbi:MAG: organoarsenical effux MFS transporter ArsJ [Planctomycetes bacterium]|nr:organoarsenical effux MFS transporter ArsJ [Planctomycetota bacterium]